MRSLHFLARFCARQIVLKAPARPAAANLGRSYSSFRYGLLRTVRTNPRPGYRTKGTLLKASIGGAGVLGTAAFVKLSEKDNGGNTEQTAEERMLQASRDELAKTVDEDRTILLRVAQQAIILLDVYMWEPLCTGLRFCQLVVIFVPVILSVPAIWIGRRQPSRDNERSGTLWWYSFLIWGMETAGPAFIKVRMIPLLCSPLLSFSLLC